MGGDVEGLVGAVAWVYPNASEKLLQYESHEIVFVTSLLFDVGSWESNDLDDSGVCCAHYCIHDSEPNVIEKLRCRILGKDVSVGVFHQPTVRKQRSIR